MKGDLAYDSLLKFILALLVIAILIAFFTGYIDDITGSSCYWISDAIGDLTGSSGGVC